jgi:hypothetical protein
MVAIRLAMPHDVIRKKIIEIIFSKTGVSDISIPIAPIFHLFSGILLLERIPDGIQYDIHVIHDVIVPKAYHTIAPRFKIGCAFLVMFLLFKMLTAIQFDERFPAWSARRPSIRCQGKSAL